MTDDFKLYSKIIKPQDISLLTFDNFIKKSNNNKINQFNIIKKISIGSFAKTYLASCKKNENIYVVLKKINLKKNEYINTVIYNEISNLNELNHPYIIKMFDFFNNGLFFYIVFEYAKYGELFDIYDPNMNEKEISKIIIQIAYAIKECHIKNIVHKDIKLENIVKYEDNHYKLIDFGCSINLNHPKLVPILSGTLEYMSPETFLVRDKMYLNTDLWCIGILIYELYTNRNPFILIDEEIDRYNKIKYNVLYEDVFMPEFFSENLIDLLTKCFEKDPNLRININDFITHPWFINCI